MPTNQDGAPSRKRTVETLLDLLKEALSVPDLTAPEAAEACGLKIENTRKWLEALEAVGILTPALPRKEFPHTPGKPQKTWKLSPWVRNG